MVGSWVRLRKDHADDWKFSNLKMTSLDWPVRYVRKVFRGVRKCSGRLPIRLRWSLHPCNLVFGSSKCVRKLKLLWRSSDQQEADLLCVRPNFPVAILNWENGLLISGGRSRFPAQGCSGSLMPKPCSKKGCFGGFLDRKALENADGVRRKITTGNVGGARGFSLSQSVMGRFWVIHSYGRGGCLAYLGVQRLNLSP